MMLSIADKTQLSGDLSDISERSVFLSFMMNGELLRCNQSTVWHSAWIYLLDTCCSRCVNVSGGHMLFTQLCCCFCLLSTVHCSSWSPVSSLLLCFYTVSQKKRVNFETIIAQNYNHRFWWNLAEIFKRLQNRLCMFQFSCRCACYHVIVSQTAYRR